MWKDLTVEDAKSQIKRCTKKIANEDDILKYSNELITTKMDFNKPLWELHLAEDYPGGRSILFARIHHAFSDGVGFVSFMSCILDNPYKLSMKKKIEPKGFLSEMFYTFFGPLYSLHMTNKLKALSSDPQGNKITETTMEKRQPDRIFMTKEIDFNSVTK